MNKEELIEFLKSNLKIGIDSRNDYEGDLNVEISITLEDKDITHDSFCVFFPKQRG